MHFWRLLSGGIFAQIILLELIGVNNMMLASTIDFFANVESSWLGPNIDCCYPMDKSSIRKDFFFLINNQTCKLGKDTQAMIQGGPAQSRYLQIYLDSWITPSSDHFLFFKSLFYERFWVCYIN